MSALSPRQMFLLDEACRPIAEAFDATPYLVGTAAARQQYRDVDVRVMLDPEQWQHLREAGDHVLEYMSLVIGQHLANVTGLPIDFQLQHATVANAEHLGVRNPLGIRSLENYRGDAWPRRAPNPSPTTEAE